MQLRPRDGNQNFFERRHFSQRNYFCFIPPTIESRNQDMDIKENIDPFEGLRKNALISIEGNICSGKTTVLKYLQKQYPTVKILDEPLESWRNVGGKNLLKMMYDDPKRWSFTFQANVITSCVKMYTQKEIAEDLKILERSPHSAVYCFSENLLDEGNITETEYAVLSSLLKCCTDESGRPGLDLIIYLRTLPETCFQRLIKRNRSEESAVTMNLLQNLHQKYENWLFHKNYPSSNCPVMILDADGSLESTVDIFRNGFSTLASRNPESALKLSYNK